MHAAIKAFLPEIANTMEKKFSTSLGMGIGTRRLVAKVLSGSAAEVKANEAVIEAYLGTGMKNRMAREAGMAGGAQ